MFVAWRLFTNEIYWSVASEAPVYLIITGSAIANGTIERLLQLPRNAGQVAVVGPSASIIPDVLFMRRVSLIGGVIARDPDKAMQIVAEGGGTPKLKSAMEFVVIKPVSAHGSQGGPASK
jgi:uncharacterized protein (DUF4213/DUF364 family)